MVLGNKLGEKSRRERRKEARLLKKKKKFDSWTQHQKYQKLKKCSMDSNPVKVMKFKNPSTQSLEKREVLETDIDSKSHHSSEKLSMLKKIENRLDSSRFPNSTASKTIEGIKGLKKSESKFKDYLAMKMQHDATPAEDDLEMERKLAKKLKVKDGKLGGVDDDINMLFEGIPSVINFFKEEGNPISEEVVKRSKNNSSSKKRKKRKSLEKGLEHCSDMTGRAGAMESDTDVVSEHVETSGTKSKPKQVSANLPDLNGNVKYVAPHLRSRMQNESEEYCQIRRRVRGLLNRLSESNVESTTDEMSTIFRSVARSVGSMIINGEVLASCSGGPRGNEQYAAVFAAFVAGMASVVGIDFGAKLLASLAKCFEEEYLEEDNLSLRNLTLLLSYLYVFGVCSSDLIYDFMIMLSKRLTEIDVSTILTILQCCGTNLRGEDHAAMKSFVLSVQNRANELRGSSGIGLSSSSSKRMEFMLEIITDIKNNKKRAKVDTPQHTRIKKWLQKLRVEDIKILGLKWSKLLDPDKKGQWWLCGDLAPLVSSVEQEVVGRTVEKETLEEVHKLLQLAIAEGMNTDVRRSIFCVIMGAEDYMDAFEKLLRLNLRGKQDREIMRVLVQCCLHEQLYNKYYPILATRLCSHDNNHKTTLKYCLWDHFKELDSMDLKRSMHLSKFVADMFASFTLSVSVLKIVDFNNTRRMVARRIKHFQLIFEAIFQHPDTLVWNIFSRIAANPDCESLRQGIEFFINKYVVSNKDSIANKSKIVKKALASVEGDFMGS